MSNGYLKFLQAISKLESDQNIQKNITPVAVLLLNEIAIKEFEENPMTISQAMELKAFGSRSTLHRKLAELRLVGLVETRQLESNKVAKYLFTTQSAKNDFQIKSKIMLKVVRSR